MSGTMSVPTQTSAKSIVDHMFTEVKSLCGKMSLITPRPLTEHEVYAFKEMAASLETKVDSYYEKQAKNLKDQAYNVAIAQIMYEVYGVSSSKQLKDNKNIKNSREDIKAREQILAHMNQQTALVREREEKLAEREADYQRRLAELNTREAELQTRDLELVEREVELDGREDEITRKEKELTETSEALQDFHSSLKAMKVKLAKRKEKLAKRKVVLDSREKSLNERYHQQPKVQEVHQQEEQEQQEEPQEHAAAKGLASQAGLAGDGEISLNGDYSDLLSAGTVKRAPTSYNIYSRLVKERVKSQNPSVKGNEITKLIAQQYKIAKAQGDVDYLEAVEEAKSNTGEKANTAYHMFYGRAKEELHSRFPQMSALNVRKEIIRLWKLMKC